MHDKLPRHRLWMRPQQRDCRRDHPSPSSIPGSYGSGQHRLAREHAPDRLAHVFDASEHASAWIIEGCRWTDARKV